LPLRPCRKSAALAPNARIAAFGLYAPVNAPWLKRLGVEAIFGGESEPDLLDWVQSGVAPAEPLVRRDRIEFLLPERRGLPDLQRYARLILADDTQKITGFAEASRAASTCAGTVQWCRCIRASSASCRWRQ
jgi:hypothetical protein